MYLRSFYHPNGHAISLVAVSNLAHVVFYSKEDSGIHVCHTNSSELTKANARETLNCLMLSKDAEYLIAAGTNKTIFFYRLHKYALLSLSLSFSLVPLFLFHSLSLFPSFLLCSDGALCFWLVWS